MNLRAFKQWGFQLLLGFLTLGFVVACQGSSLTGSEDRVVEHCTPVDHAAGATCVPEAFERLVTLDSVAFECAIALGLNPVGTVQSDYQALLEPLQTEAKNIGKQGEPSLEQVLTIQPDLIAGLAFNEAQYGQLSKIAPTLLFEFEYSGQWKTVFHEVATALGQATAADSVMADYYARAADFQAQMGDELKDFQVSVVRLYPDTISLYLKDSFAGTVLQDAGLARPPSQTLGAAAAVQRFGNPIQVQISREQIAQADGDVIFLWTGDNTAEERQRSQEQLLQLQQDPIWQQLKAVQTGRVYVVPGYWIGNGPIAANAILDDLFNYLVEGS
ncbi:MAG: iron-siderophore ABC transporter substrate-binding protein [Leptolyngbyaceae cyanobacterium SM2_5_2]|nr:iron-siderophore ABC transporter substrate-binding protein [Leptolyngbyaceae cyanobacterium SM2_5_2]